MENMKEIKETVRVLTDLIWNAAEANEPKPEPALTTPPGIKFWVGKVSRKVLGMLFNDNKQCLAYCDVDKVFEVQSTCNGTSDIKECLPMTPCEYGDLKAGDFSFSISTDSDTMPFKSCVTDLHIYELNLPDNKKVNVEFDGNINTELVIGPHMKFWKIG